MHPFPRIPRGRGYELLNRGQSESVLRWMGGHWPRRHLTVRASAGRRFADSPLPFVQLSEALFGVFEERPAVPFVSDGHEYPIGIGSTGTFQPLPYAPLIIVNLGKIAIGRHFIKKERQGLATPLDTAVEFGISLHKKAACQIGASQVEATNPSIQQFVGFGQRLYRFAGFAVPGGKLAVDQLCICLRLSLQVGSQSSGQLLCFGQLITFDECSGDQEFYLGGLAVGQGLFSGGNCRTLLPSPKLRLCQSSILVSGTVAPVGCYVGRRALLERSDSLCETALVRRQIGETLSGHGRT